MTRLNFEITSKDKLARTGTLTTKNGVIQTPCFMPVGTRAAVKTLTSADLEMLEAEIILANTYHLMLRPGDELISKQGGLHKFMDWKRPILTDSGGFQILSLKPKIHEAGAIFKSVYDGSEIELTPQKAVQIQTNLGSDIQMVLDVCPPLFQDMDSQTSDSQDTGSQDTGSQDLKAAALHLEQVRHAVKTTTIWAARGRETFLATKEADSLAQFGIVQGGLDLELRQESATQIQDIGFEGYAIGGLSVGETTADRNKVLGKITGMLPEDSPRYLMGVGDVLSLMESIAVGVDMFDCVLPTRLARHATALTSEGKLNISAATFAEDERPLDPGFPESPANRWSRSYLRHLFSVKEPTAARILTLHNLAFIFEMMKKARANIEAGTFSKLLKETRKIWG